MELGLAQFSTDYTIHPARLATLAEQHGFESLLFTEHTHIPVRRETPYPGGGELPEMYSHSRDLFVVLAMAAAVTERIKLGSGVCLVIQRDPIITAKEVASLDTLSGGRVLFGVGAGWNREEMLNHGTDPRRRFSVMRERIEAMKAIWTQDEAEYHGEHVDFDPIWCWPKPAQKPHPPVVVGGRGEKVLDRVIALGDEWMPNRVEDAGGAGGTDRGASRARRPARARVRLRGEARAAVPRAAGRGRRRPGDRLRHAAGARGGGAPA